MTVCDPRRLCPCVPYRVWPWGVAGVSRLPRVILNWFCVPGAYYWSRSFIGTVRWLARVGVNSHEYPLEAARQGAQPQDVIETIHQADA